MMRLFIGIELPAEIKKELKTILTPLQWAPKGQENIEDYHITLLFIGPVPLEQIPSIRARLKEITFSPFFIHLKDISFFRRRILYISCRPKEKMLELKIKLMNQFPDYLHPETKEFVPHITIKRWQRYEYDELKKQVEAIDLKNLSFKVSNLALFKSEKDEFNRKYHVIERS